MSFLPATGSILRLMKNAPSPRNRALKWHENHLLYYFIYLFSFHDKSELNKSVHILNVKKRLELRMLEITQKLMLSIQHVISIY